MSTTSRRDDHSELRAGPPWVMPAAHGGRWNGTVATTMPS
jgi:hypothetical protein